MLQVALWWMIGVCGKVVMVMLAIWLVKELTMGICRCTADLEGKVVIITGATSGLGLEAAIQLAKRGARLILGCRNLEKAKIAIQEILHHVEEADLEAIELDMANLKSIANFANEVTLLTNEVHILVNNAGVYLNLEDETGKPIKKVTDDGLELVVGTNYFGHFQLTRLLLDLLRNGGKAGDPSRIVTVSSIGHLGGPLNKDDFDLNSNKRPYNPHVQYFASKMAQIVWSNHLARSFSENGDPIISVSLHPGLVLTRIFDNSPARTRFFTDSRFAGVACKNREQGVQSVLHASLASNPVEKLNGKYIADCREEKWFVRANEINDTDLQERLWEYTSDLLSAMA